MGIRVTGKALRLEALHLHQLYGNQSFKTSKERFNRYKKCHNLSFIRTTQIAQHSKKFTDDLVDKFLRFVIKLHCSRLKRGIGADQDYFMLYH